MTWQSKTQASVALFTMETEYIALAAEVQEVEIQRMVFKELREPVMQPTVTGEDNNACQLIADHARKFNRINQINVRYRFVLKRIAKGSVRVHYVATAENEAGILTKALRRKPIIIFRALIVVSRSTVKFNKTRL